jgi:anti-sigma factor RsiW
MSAKPNPVPDWLLERLAAGELPESQAKELRKRLAEQGEESRLTALAQSNQEILGTLPPEEVVPEIERRAAREQRAHDRRVQPVWVLSAAVACTAGLVAMVALRRRPNTARPQLPTVEDIVIKGLKPSLRIHRKTRAGAELLAAGARVRKGDTLQLGYVAAGRRFGVIASIDARGTVTLHLPETPGPAAALERDGERALAHAFELDDSPGFERFVFVAADSLFTTADVTSALAAGHAFPTSLSTVEITLKKETP